MKFGWNAILNFCKKNIRYIAAGVAGAALVVVLAVTAAVRGNNSEDGQGDKQNEESNQENQAEAFAMDAIPEINTLITDYFAAYAAGDTDALAAYATPVSDIEKSYITVMSRYITSYDNIRCFTKRGLTDSQYAVSVTLDMHFEGIDTAAPGLDFFYVRKNESGAYYIDNLYSQFNLQNREQELDSQVEAFIDAYESQEDMLAMCADVQDRYEKALAADENLKNMVEVTVQDALKNWVAEITGTADQQPADNTPEDNTPEDNTPEDNTPADNTPEDTAVTQEVSETVYATGNINIRKSPGETADIIGTAVIGDSFTRKGIREDGWSQIDYYGAKAYIKSDYLSIEKPEILDNTEDGNSGVNYIPRGKKLTMTKAVNVRKGMDENSDRIGTTEIGDTVKVILSYAEGWTKVEWNGKTGYIKTSILLNN